MLRLFDLLVASCILLFERTQRRIRTITLIYFVVAVVVCCCCVIQITYVSALFTSKISSSLIHLNRITNSNNILQRRIDRFSDKFVIQNDDDNYCHHDNIIQLQSSKSSDINTIISSTIDDINDNNYNYRTSFHNNLNPIVVDQKQQKHEKLQTIPYVTKYNFTTTNSQNIFKKTRHSQLYDSSNSIEIDDVNNLFSKPDNDSIVTSIKKKDLICRVVSLSDKKLSTLPITITNSHNGSLLLQKLEAIYHAQAHRIRKPIIQYMNEQRRKIGRFDNNQLTQKQTNQQQKTTATPFDQQQELNTENELVHTMRKSLEDAGFNLLCRRDLDLCEGLNAGYLLRLSIVPDVKELDPNICREFYPELFNQLTGQPYNQSIIDNQLLFDGRILVYWRGYSQEVTNGRLLLPKIDYLQSSIVQRLSGMLKRQIDTIELSIVTKVSNIYRQILSILLRSTRQMIRNIPNQYISQTMKQILVQIATSTTELNSQQDSIEKEEVSSQRQIFKFTRYGGTKIRFVGSPNPLDVLNPFIICEETLGYCNDHDSNVSSSTVTNFDECIIDNDDELNRHRNIDQDLYEQLNTNKLRCPYDKTNRDMKLPPMQLLERVSISNLVDLFTKEGRNNLIQTIFSQSELVEPTYEEVVVIWRPLPDKNKIKKQLDDNKNILTSIQDNMKNMIRKLTSPPKYLYEIADMFDIEGLPEQQLPPEPSLPLMIKKLPIEIRAFQDVPMANLPAVLPKTKLMFRPADALRFDLISIVSFVFVATSLKFDNPKLDIIAFISITLWSIRTVIRYSNKLARYDLLVKTFLTSKISHRNSGAIQYLTSEAATQKSLRTSLIYYWLMTKKQQQQNNNTINNFFFDRKDLIEQGNYEINDNILCYDDTMRQTPINISAALDDLIDLNLLICRRQSNHREDDDARRFFKIAIKTDDHQSTNLLELVQDEYGISQALKMQWDHLFHTNTDKQTKISPIDNSSNMQKKQEEEVNNIMMDLPSLLP